MTRDNASAIGQAIEIYRFPIRLADIKAQQLADDVEYLLSAIDNRDVMNEIAERYNIKSVDILESAIGFYIEQVLLEPNSDPFRTLGASPSTPKGQLRKNFAALMRWLHPDRNVSEERTIYTNRVLQAWQQLKTEERRIASDRESFKTSVISPQEAGWRTGATRQMQLVAPLNKGRTRIRKRKQRQRHAPRRAATILRLLAIVSIAVLSITYLFGSKLLSLLVELL
ncbi:MAG: hypothetical protein AB7F96_09110 [Beijerinckiaceae bacterium]